LPLNGGNAGCPCRQRRHSGSTRRRGGCHQPARL